MFPMTVTIADRQQLDAVMSLLAAGAEPADIPQPAETVATPVQVAEQPTYQLAAEAITNLARAKGRDAAVSVLSKFSATKLPDVKPEQFAELIAAATAAQKE